MILFDILQQTSIVTIKKPCNSDLPSLGPLLLMKEDGYKDSKQKTLVLKIVKNMF